MYSGGYPGRSCTWKGVCVSNECLIETETSNKQCVLDL